MNFQQKTLKYDKLIYGIVLGLILPIIGFFVSYFIKTRGIDITFNDYFLKRLLHSEEKMDIIIFSMIPNMLLFYFVNFKWNMFEFTKGIVGVTLIMGILVVILGM